MSTENVNIEQDDRKDMAIEYSTRFHPTYGVPCYHHYQTWTIHRDTTQARVQFVFSSHKSHLACAKEEILACQVRGCLGSWFAETGIVEASRPGRWENFPRIREPRVQARTPKTPVWRTEAGNALDAMVLLVLWCHGGRCNLVIKP